MSLLLYTLEGRSIIPCASITKWTQWFKVANRSIERTRIGNVYVSTVFLGVDYSVDVGSTPILFETRVFGGALDGKLERCATYAETVAMHKQMVARVRFYKVELGTLKSKTREQTTKEK